MAPTFLVAPDSFKGSLTASDAAMIMTRAIRSEIPTADVTQIPVADGGEGTVETLVTSTLGYFVEAAVTNAYGGRDIVPWGILGNARTAVMEIASCAGLAQTPVKKRDPKLTTTYGLGELIQEALDEKCTELLIGLGGSATNDGGAGMARALGARLLDRKGKDIDRGGAALLTLHTIDLSSFEPRLGKTRCTGLCDVENPLLGRKGAVAQYARQKGALETDLALLEDALARFADVVHKDLGKNVTAIPGSGAAGGLGAGLVAFLDATLLPGIEAILDRTGFDAKCAAVDVVFTGEGKIDEQTSQGKAIMGIGLRASKKKKPVYAFAGSCDEKERKLAKALRLTGMFCITPEEATEEEAMSNAAHNLEERVRAVVREKFKEDLS